MAILVSVVWGVSRYPFPFMVPSFYPMHRHHKFDSLPHVYAYVGFYKVSFVAGGFSLGGSSARRPVLGDFPALCLAWQVKKHAKKVPYLLPLALRYGLPFA